MADRGWMLRPQTLPQPQPERSQASNKQLRKAEVFMGLHYHNPNPWFSLLGMVQMQSEIEIDGRDRQQH